jgi:hypothetical protein
MSVRENEIEADVLPERTRLPAISSGQRLKPTIRIEHRKPGAIIDYPLETNGVRFYADIEEVLALTGYQLSFASLKTRTPNRSRSAACNISFSACVKPLAG